MSTNTSDLKPAIEAIARLVAPNLKPKQTHEKQISRTVPWLVLATGGVVLFAAALLLGFAALHAVLTPGLSIGLFGIGGVGALLIFIGLPLQKRAEDWENWRTPARQIAETHKAVEGNHENIDRLTTLVEAIEMDRVRREHRLMEMVEECSERQGAAISAVLHAVGEIGESIKRPGTRDAVDPKYLADMSEAVRLGEELERRRHQPPEQQPN